jgi:hypothetical protein
MGSKLFYKKTFPIRKFRHWEKEQTYPYPAVSSTISGDYCMVGIPFSPSGCSRYGNGTPTLLSGWFYLIQQFCARIKFFIKRSRPAEIGVPSTPI